MVDWSYWITDDEMLIKTSGDSVVKNATKISKTEYDRIKKAKEKILEGLEMIEDIVEASGCHVDEDDNVYL